MRRENHNRPPDRHAVMILRYGEEVDDDGTKFFGSLLLAYKFPISDTENERGYVIKDDSH